MRSRLETAAFSQAPAIVDVRRVAAAAAAAVVGVVAPAPLRKCADSARDAAPTKASIVLPSY